MGSVCSKIRKFLAVANASIFPLQFGFYEYIHLYIPLKQAVCLLQVKASKTPKTVTGSFVDNSLLVCNFFKYAVACSQRVDPQVCLGKHANVLPLACTLKIQLAKLIRPNKSVAVKGGGVLSSISLTIGEFIINNFDLATGFLLIFMKYVFNFSSL